MYKNTLYSYRVLAHFRKQKSLAFPRYFQDEKVIFQDLKCDTKSYFLKLYNVSVYLWFELCRMASNHWKMLPFPRPWAFFQDLLQLLSKSLTFQAMDFALYVPSTLTPCILNPHPMYPQPSPYVCPTLTPCILRSTPCTLNPHPMYPQPSPHVSSTLTLCMPNPHPMYPAIKFFQTCEGGGNIFAGVHYIFLRRDKILFAIMEGEGVYIKSIYR